jgi:hypothetical protein
MPATLRVRAAKLAAPLRAPASINSGVIWRSLHQRHQQAGAEMALSMAASAGLLQYLLQSKQHQHVAAAKPMASAA